MSPLIYSASDTIDYTGLLEKDGLIQEIYKPIIHLMHHALHNNNELSASMRRIHAMRSS